MKTALPELIVAIIVAAGIPSTIFGILARKFAKKEEDRAASWIDGMASVLETTNANYHLGRECAKALIRLDPERKFRNGDFDEAMAYALQANHAQEEYLRREAAKRHG